MLKEIYCLVVIGTFERAPIEFENYPTEKEIADAIKELNGNSARVEKRYKLTSS